MRVRSRALTALLAALLAGYLAFVATSDLLGILRSDLPVRFASTGTAYASGCGEDWGGCYRILPLPALAHDLLLLLGAGFVAVGGLLRRPFLLGASGLAVLSAWLVQASARVQEAAAADPRALPREWWWANLGDAFVGLVLAAWLALGLILWSLPRAPSLGPRRA